MNDAMKLFASILTALIGAAIVSVVLSRNSQTSNVLSSFFGGFAGVLRVAVSPVTGAAGGGSASGGGVASPTNYLTPAGSSNIYPASAMMTSPGSSYYSSPITSANRANVGGLLTQAFNYFTGPSTTTAEVSPTGGELATAAVVSNS